MKSSPIVTDTVPTGKQGNRLVLIDFDGTITTRDTLIEFIRFYRGDRSFLAGLITLSPVLAAYALRLTENWKAKEKLMTKFFGGEDIKRFNEMCTRFATEVIPQLVRPSALEEIRRHQESGAVVTVVSASAENWVKPWCLMHDLNCLATRMEVVSGKLTGRFSGRNCYGDEKVCRIREAYNLDNFNEIIAYGDSSGDHEMLAMAHVAHYKPFRSNADVTQTTG